jgi:catechol 2,3-dioxygenase-like lactoylglutathione lyase family enzyme
MTVSPSLRLSVVTLGVANIRASLRFYLALGLSRKVSATGEAVVFFDAGNVVLALYPWGQLAADARLAERPHPVAFRGSTLAWNCGSDDEVDVALARAATAGARLLKPAEPTGWGGYSGYFADPDGHPWEVVHAPMFALGADGRLVLPD